MKRIVLLIFVLLPALLLAAGMAAAAPVAPLAAESEPNDTQATADAIALGQTTAAINVVGDVDYFKLSLSAGQRVYLAALDACNDTTYLGLAVFNAAGVLLHEPGEWPDGNIIFNFLAQETADYFIRVLSTGTSSGTLGNYTLLVQPMPADEPNDSPATATPITWGADLSTDHYAPYDLDYYRIHARPGDVIEATYTNESFDPWYDARLYLFDENGDAAGGVQLDTPGTATLTFVVPAEGDYFLYPTSPLDQCTMLVVPEPYRLQVARRSLHVVGGKAGTVNGVGFGLNDVLARNAAGQWQKVFDGEDVGITAALNAIEWLGDDLLLALKEPQNVPGLGQVKAQDILKFTPSQLGNNTQGALSFYLRGTQAGLTTLGERVDAIALLDTGDLLISVTGSAAVPQFGGGSLTVRNEDLVLYHPSGAMPAAGTWSMQMDGTQFLKKFSGFNVRSATIYDDYIDDPADPYQWGTWLYMGLDKPYNYQPWPYSDPKVTAAPGDLIAMQYEHGNAYEYYSYLDTPLTRAALGFPRLISSIAIGD